MVNYDLLVVVLNLKKLKHSPTTAQLLFRSKDLAEMRRVEYSEKYYVMEGFAFVHKFPVAERMIPFTSPDYHREQQILAL